MAEISTDYKPNFALGALYQGFNAANADEDNLQEIMRKYLSNQREQNQEPLDRLIKSWQAKESLGKLQDPEYLKSLLEGYKGQMNSQVAAGKKAMGTVDTEIPAINQENVNRSQMGDLLNRFYKAQYEQEPSTEQQGSIGFPMQSSERIPEQWGGEGLQNGSKVTWSGPNPPKDISRWTDWGGNQLGNIGKQSDMVKSFGIDKDVRQPVLSNMVKQDKAPSSELARLTNTLVNSPEHLRAKELASIRGDYALEGIDMRTKAMLDVAGKRMTGKDKPLKLDEGIQIANDIVARNEPGEKLEWAKRYLLTVASVKAASTATANTPTISLPSTVETGKPVNNATPAEKLSQLLGKQTHPDYLPQEPTYRERQQQKANSSLGTKENPIKLP